MQIIVISDRFARARSITLTVRLFLLLALLGAAIISAIASGLYWLTLNHANRFEFNFPSPFSVIAKPRESDHMKVFVQQNLNAMAVKLGEMQAQLARLDALGERLSSAAGIAPQEFRFKEVPGLGGAATTHLPPQNLTLLEFNERLQALTRDVEGRTDMLGVLEARLYEHAIRRNLLPTMMPVTAPYNASGFGYRIDPFSGQRAMHEGIDFLADKGTPIVAAANGIVSFAGFHPQYGYMIDLDHGNDLVTRYAHASKLYVKEGDVVQRGAKISLVGSTGRSTGPHLHFEVRHKGQAQNPMRFLAAGKDAGATDVAARGKARRR